MKYVKSLDPTDYLERLPSFTDELPPGARAFATEPGHYDFMGKRCVKDLKLKSVRFHHDEDRTLDIDFRHNCWKHEDDLTIHYVGVKGFTADIGRESPWWEQVVTLDEVLPVSAGCQHEIAFLTGSITIRCRDLTAIWLSADRREK